MESPLFRSACLHRILPMMAVHTAFTSLELACRMNVSWDFLRRNQISKRRPLSPTFSVIPISAVCPERSRGRGKGGGELQGTGCGRRTWARTGSHLEGLFVDVDVVSSFDLFGLAEEDEVLEQEDVAEVLPAAAPHYELVLAAELTLLLQVHLQRRRRPLMCVATNNTSSWRDSDLILLKPRPPD